jgi:hypothetical protein
VHFLPLSSRLCVTGTADVLVRVESEIGSILRKLASFRGFDGREEREAQLAPWLVRWSLAVKLYQNLC